MAYNKITLYGEQICDYLYVQTEKPLTDDFSHVNDEPLSWNSSTVLYANFKDPERRLAAGDSAVVGSIEGYEVYRKKYNESHSEYIGTIKKSNSKAGDLMVDYAVRNGIEYSYYFYPKTNISEGGSTLHPLVTKQSATNCPYWSLLIVDETEEENVYYLDKLFKFELNLQIEDMNNNAQISIVQNFTKYPTVQYGSSNYWSGSLSSLCGFISANCTDYVQTINMVDELKSITSDTRKKFLKDIDGNIWEVDVSEPITISTENMALQSLKTLDLSWVETGSADGVSIINNPDRLVSDWVLTENGNAIPYFTYQWGENYIWDNSYIWTSNDNSRINQNTNLGRNMIEGEMSNE